MVKTRKLRVVRRDCRVLTQYGDRPAYRAANFEKNKRQTTYDMAYDTLRR